MNIVNISLHIWLITFRLHPQVNWLVCQSILSHLLKLNKFILFQDYLSSLDPKTVTSLNTPSFGAFATSRSAPNSVFESLHEHPCSSSSSISAHVQNEWPTSSIQRNLISAGRSQVITDTKSESKSDNTSTPIGVSGPWPSSDLHTTRRESTMHLDSSDSESDSDSDFASGSDNSTPELDGLMEMVTFSTS